VITQTDLLAATARLQIGSKAISDADLPTYDI
jgi:hypothetical protein